MAINPFKDSNLNDLQDTLSKYISDHYETIRERVGAKRDRFMTKGRERITVMFIPHSEKKIVNFRISIFAIAFLTGAIVLTVAITSFFIVKHSSTVKEVSILKSYGSNSEVQIKAYKDEMNKLYEIFQKLKPEITYLYSMTPNSNIDSLWAMGGLQNSETPADADAVDINAPSMEELNIQEMERELQTTKNLMSSIKNFFKYRKKIIENTPSIWPTDGYIISRYGQRTSPYSFKEEFHRGVDIEAFPGAEVIATAPGTVEDIRWDNSLGITVSIKHKYGFITSYSHCQRVTVEIGQKVSKSETIGYVGKTGKTTKYTCYYQVKIGTEFVDPVPYLNSIAQ